MKLSDTARVTLSRASQHPKHLAEAARHLAAAPRDAKARLFQRGLMEELPSAREDHVPARRCSAPNP
jgi:hypothetical protein